MKAGVRAAAEDAAQLAAVRPGAGRRGPPSGRRSRRPASSPRAGPRRSRVAEFARLAGALRQSDAAWLTAAGLDHRYIVVEGPIGVGKTSLTQHPRRALQAAGSSWRSWRRTRSSRSFYQDRQKFAFQTQIFFLLSRFQQQQELLPAGPLRRGHGERLPVRQGPDLRLPHPATRTSWRSTTGSSTRSGPG